MKGKTRDKIIGIIFAVITIAGLICLLYPTVSDVINTVNQTKAIHKYQERTKELPEKDYEKAFKEAREYNEKLYELEYPLYEAEQIDGYDDVLNIEGNGVMGYVSIPKIDIKLPIFHGTDDKVLGNAVGHLFGSSVPVGGENTHSIIAAHRGMTSARLFTDVDKLEKGDRFTVTVLNKVLIYEVDDIQIVLPEETNPLEIIKGGDYLTLQTCTPYGVNSHRLLIRGKHIDTKDVDDEDVKEYEVEETITTVLFNKRNITPVIISGCLVITFVAIRIIINKRRNHIKNGVNTNNE